VAPPGAALAASFPAAATGDIWFQVDHAGFLGEGGATLEEFYLRLPHDQVSFDAPGAGEVGPWSGRVFVKLTFLDADDDRVGEASRSFEFSAVDEAAALSHDRVQLFVIREPLDPRTHSVRVDLEDMNARKRGLIYLITKQHRRGYRRSAPRSRPAASACPIGCWQVDRRTGSKRFDVVPNPGRHGSPDTLWLGRGTIPRR
jgi:hypothetical protein